MSPPVGKLNFATFSYSWPESDETTRHVFSKAFRAGPGITTLRLALPPSTLGTSVW
ncbi:hypothetical protein BD309DRAFT_701441 [Dichomitus squalens]|nr:hypothetical protein BD309DRAFT_701441 [Dichomitus squalens]